jgi:hypothetical protein
MAGMQDMAHPELTVDEVEILRSSLKKKMSIYSLQCQLRTRLVEREALQGAMVFQG